MKKSNQLKSILSLFLFIYSFSVNSQIFVDWDDPRRHDSIMVLKVHELKANNLVPIFEIAKNLSRLFEFANDSTLNSYYTINFRYIEKNQIEVVLFSSQTSGCLFSLKSATGILSNSIIIYDSTKFLINYLEKEDLVLSFIERNFVITDEDYILKDSKTSNKYWHNENVSEGFKLVFEVSYIENKVKLLKVELRNVQ